MTDGIGRARQARAEQALERLRETTARLLESHQWEALPLQFILKSAGVSVGSFYHHFTDKEALLADLDQRYTSDVLLEITRLCEVFRSVTDIGSRARIFVSEIVNFYTFRRGLARALILRARRLQINDPLPTTQRLNRLFHELSKAFVHGTSLDDESGHQRASFALSLIHSAVREQILYPESSASTPGTNEWKDSATRMIHMGLLCEECRA